MLWKSPRPAFRPEPPAQSPKGNLQSPMQYSLHIARLASVQGLSSQRDPHPKVRGILESCSTSVDVAIDEKVAEIDLAVARSFGISSPALEGDENPLLPGRAIGSGTAGP
jgi:hypothetical protein